jgi:hypothetical protein
VGPSVRERVGRVGDLGASAGVGVLMRRVVGTVRARAMHGAACAVYPSLDVGTGLFSDAWRARACETVVPNLQSY